MTLAGFVGALSVVAMSLLENGIPPKAIEDVDRALVGVEVTCTYRLVSKNSSLPPPGYIEKKEHHAATGFFIEGDARSYFILTAGHSFCIEPLPEDVSAEEFAVSKISIKTKVFYAKQYFDAMILQSSSSKDNSVSDIALLLVTLPETIHPYQIPLSTEKPQRGTMVLVRGYMAYAEKPMRRLKLAVIEEAEDLRFQMQTSLYPLMSGSPVMVFKDDRFMALGIATLAMCNSMIGHGVGGCIMEYGMLDMSFATPIPPNLLESQAQP